MNDFQFKEFTVHQDKTAMKVGTDGVLLGAWADIARASRILDIGTGTGLIALMAAQRRPNAQIDAVEINRNAYEQAKMNIMQSKWSQRITIHCLSVFDYHPSHLFDSIICNPPFFTASTRAPDIERSMARHCMEFTHNGLLEYTGNVLKKDGILSVILPVEEGKRLIASAAGCNLYLKRMTEVFPTTKSVQPKRWLLEFSPLYFTPEKDQLIIEYERHRYTPEYIDLTKDFYLYM